jgi:hypothetical protein
MKRNKANTGVWGRNTRNVVCRNEIQQIELRMHVRSVMYRTKRGAEVRRKNMNNNMQVNQINQS